MFEHEREKRMMVFFLRNTFEFLWQVRRDLISNFKERNIECTIIFFFKFIKVYKRAPGPLIDKFYQNLSSKGSEAQKQRPQVLLWMLWFDEKYSISNIQLV